MDYRTEYWEKNPSLHLEDAELKFQQVKNFLNKVVLKKKKILDIACGAGAITNKLQDYFAQTGGEVTGVDISSTAISFARTHFKGPKFEIGDATNLQFKNGSYDLVTVFDLFEHLEDYKPVLTKLNGLSEYYIFRLPMEDCLFSSILNLLNNSEFKRLEEKYGHIHHFNPKVWRKALRTCEYEILGETFYKVPKRKVFLRNWIQSVLFPIAPYINNRINGGFMITFCKTQK